MSLDSNPLLLVIGALHTDEVATAKAPMITGESNPVSWSRFAGGVGANVARAAAINNHLSVVLLTNTGNDKDGCDLKAALANTGVQVKSILAEATRTGRYSAILQPSGELLVGLADVEQAQAITLAKARSLINFQSPAAVALDTNLSASAIADISNAIRYVNPHCLIVALGVSPSKINRLESSLQNVDILFCNEQEAKQLTSIKFSEKPLDEKIRLLEPSAIGCNHLVITQGNHNVLVCSEGQHSSITVPNIHTSQTANGPGDALAGATLSHLMQVTLTHESLVQAVTHYGIPAAAKVITGEIKAPALNIS